MWYLASFFVVNGGKFCGIWRILINLLNKKIIMLVIKKYEA